MSLSPHQPTFVFDLLPTEVLHNIFVYLWADDILYSFYNISTSVNNIISSYKYYHVNFQSILKRDFDHICRCIRPDQIISLILSDTNDTPHQSHLYLSLFPINQFIHLRALTLIDIDNNSQSLFDNLCEIKSLVSFEIDTMSHLRYIGSQLKRLVVNKYVEDDYIHESFLSSLSFCHIQSLTLPYCSYHQLRQILSDALKLTSLTISLLISDCSGIDYFAEQRQEMSLALTYLNLSIQTFTRVISRLLFERFLGRMPHLEKLELNVSSGGSINLLDGDQWEIFILNHLPSLRIFNFKFKIINIDQNKENILAHFRTPFWLHKNRCWHVSFNPEDSILYTVPYFAPRIIKYPSYTILSHATTLPIDQHRILYDNVIELELGPDCKPSYRYRHVQKLTLLVSNIDKSIIDVSRIEYLCIRTTASWSLKNLFRMIKQSMPCVYHLNIDCDLSWTKIRDIVPLEQIRILDLSQFFFSDKKSKQIDLPFLFPNIEHLTTKINTYDQMISLIDQLKYLSHASFHIINCQTDLNQPERMHQWLLKMSHRLSTNNNFTFKLDSQSWIHFWIVGDEKPMISVCSNTHSTDVQLQRIEKSGIIQCGHSGHCLLQ
ncbi:unnamed protein product [Adineta steineri]|uniref:F-box domain-containing protein n=1 Tax=Adineta steineri TaxID=433720 RepID=A0A815BTQ9_9BILA|nr:unnamed protein product [Adineta steineri]CAF3857453.1 unnamed protein product [Adineta steineri]